MLDRRQIPRYHLASPLAGYIEHGEVRYRGKIFELSMAGFRLRLRNMPKAAFASQASAHDFGEILYQGQEIGGFGEIRYVRPDKNDLWIGFRWDDVHARDNPRSAAVIAELAARGMAGCVKVGEAGVALVGHVFSALARDLQECIDPRQPRVSLLECKSVDAGGLAMLAALEDAKVRLDDVSAEVSALLRQYRLGGAEAALGGASLRPVG